MIRRSLALAGLCALSLGACTKKGFLDAPEVDDTVTEKVGSFAAQTHFLLEPSADAEDLLGRAVHVTSKGGWTIADERAPGCRVRVKRTAAEYEKSYRIGLGDMTAMSGGYRELIKLEARYGRSVEAAMKVHNLETLTADVAGTCGEVIVKTVQVGTGERTLERKAEGAAKGRVGKGPIGVEGGREAATDASDAIRWSSPQAYAFTYEQVARRKVFEIDADIPDVVTDGDRITLKFTSDVDAYLVVYYFGADGRGSVLYPSDVAPVPMIQAGKTLVLPPRDAVLDGMDLQAQLADPKVPTRDTVVAFAFATRDDFDRFKPGALDSGDTVQYTAELTQALAGLPISRWDRHTATIEILPKTRSPTP